MHYFVHHTKCKHAIILQYYTIYFENVAASVVIINAGHHDANIEAL